MLKTTISGLKWVSRRLGLTPALRKILLPTPAATTPPPIQESEGLTPAQASYAERLQAEQQHFAIQTEVHDLPEIFHYWSNKYLRPKLEEFGFSNPDQFFVKHLEQAFAGDPATPRKFISIGAGNCDTEVRLAKALLGKKKGDSVEVPAPGGAKTYEITGVAFA